MLTARIGNTTQTTERAHKPGILTWSISSSETIRIECPFSVSKIMLRFIESPFCKQKLLQMLIKSNQMQQYADIYLLQSHSTFGKCG